MEDSLLKTNFIGRDGFRWWIGQIPPIDAWESQATGAGWGNRYKVRIMGYHPYSTAELPDEDLPWAGVLLPPGTGTGSANVSKTIKFNPGDTVIGFFLDGDNGQIPMIMGSFGNSYYAAAVKDDGEEGPFGSFTGRTTYMSKASKSVLRANEANDANASSQRSPQNLSPVDAAKKTNNANYSASSGAVIPLPTGENGSKKTIDKIKIAVEGFVSFLKNLQAAFNDSIGYAKAWIKQEIDIRAEQIAKLASGMVSGMINSLYKELIPLLKLGLKMLYDSVYAIVLAATLNPAIAHLAGVAAQTSMAEPIKALQDLIPCLCNQIIGQLTDFVKEILKSVADNVLNFVQCVGDQVIGALFNGIVGQIAEGMASALDAISKILQFFEDFSVENILRNSINALTGIIGLSSCNKQNENDVFGANKYKIGYGPIFQNEPDLSNILKISNIAKGNAQVPEVVPVSSTDKIVLDNFISTVAISSAISPTDTTIILPNLTGITTGGLLTSSSEIMQIKGFNSLVNEVTVKRAFSGVATSYTEGTSLNLTNSISEKSLTKTVSQSTFVEQSGTFDLFTGAIKDPFPTDLGSCYGGLPTSCSPPVVNIFGGGGTGAEATPLFGSIVGEGNTKTGSIISVKVTNPGNGYTFPPFIEVVDNCDQGYGAVARATIKDGKVDNIYIVSEGENYPVDEIIPYTVSDVVIIDPGSDYEDGDSVVDDLGNTYEAQIYQGSIIKVTPINIKDITDIPKLKVNSNTGSGAILVANLDIRPDFQGEVQQVIDCVT